MITLFTPFRGKVRGVAKGSRKLTSRLAGHIEQFTHTSVVIARGRNIDIITQAQTVRSFIEIREKPAPVHVRVVCRRACRAIE